MIHYEDVMHIGFLKKLPFKGSDLGMRYMLKNVKNEEGKITALGAVYWPEPYSFEATDESEKTYRNDFPFTDEGIREALKWLNDAHDAPENSGRWGKWIL